MKLLKYKEYLKENLNNNIVYRGAPSPEFGKGNWSGVFCSPDINIAKQYHGNIWKYELSDVNLINANLRESEELAENWLDNSNDPDVQYINEPDDLWIFPPDGWIDFLRKKGYDGIQYGTDRFIFNTDKLKLIGKL